MEPVMAKPKLPPCPDCGTQLNLIGVDEQRSPVVIVYSCPSCNCNYVQKVKTS